MTDNLTKAREMAAQGLYATEIARRLGVVRQTIYSMVNRGLLDPSVRRRGGGAVQPKPVPKKKRFLIDLDRAQELANQGLNRTQIAKAMGVHKTGIAKIVQDGKIRMPDDVKNRIGRPPLPKPAEKAPEPAPVVMAVKVRAVPPHPAHKPAPEPDPKHQHSPRISQLIATGGRYADLAEWARAWGVGMTGAQKAWHQLGLPIARGGRSGGTLR